MRRVKTLRKSNTANRKVKNAKPVKSHGVKFRSTLELFAYNKMKEANLEFEYEPNIYHVLSGFTYQPDCFEKTHASKDLKIKKKTILPITYLPDFSHIDSQTKTGWVLETKGYPNDAFPLRWKLFKKHLKDNGYNVRLFLAGNEKQVQQAIHLITKHYGKNNHSGIGSDGQAQEDTVELLHVG